MGVITPEGVVGKIVAVFPDTSQVLLLDDRDSGVGALLAGSRTQSPGARQRRSAPGHGVRQQRRESRPGEAVLTSGQDRIFPKDLPVGTVAQVKIDRRSSFQEILVKPAAHLDRLEEVLVLLSRQEFDAQERGRHPGRQCAAAAPAPKRIRFSRARSADEPSMMNTASDEPASPSR